VNFQNCPQTEVKIINFIHFLPRPYQKLREWERKWKTWFKKVSGEKTENSWWLFPLEADNPFYISYLSISQTARYLIGR
jgi:hypothetical protein